MKIRELLATTKPLPVAKARDLQFVGWNDGYMVVKFHGSEAFYLYGPDIPEVVNATIHRVPYPDSYFTKAVKNKFQCHKVDA